ncbi:MAG: metal-dependent hydrolase [Thermomicrobiales bacterium]
MRRVTHLTLGAAVALPIVASASPSIAVGIGCCWFGVAGGGFPDWFDLRSDLRRPLRLQHRGASHGLPVALGVTALLYLVLHLLGSSIFATESVTLVPSDTTARLWSICFLAGIVSHLASDACTKGGIRPLLPFSQWKVWLLPKPLRSRHDGWLDRLIFLGALAVIGLTTVALLANRLG